MYMFGGMGEVTYICFLCALLRTLQLGNFYNMLVWLHRPELLICQGITSEIKCIRSSRLGPILGPLGNTVGRRRAHWDHLGPALGPLGLLGGVGPGVGPIPGGPNFI